MQSARIPPPLAFDLDVAENARLRDAFIVANGGRTVRYLVAFSIVLQFIPPLLRLYRYRGNDPFDWVLLGLVSVLIVIALTVIADPQRGKMFLLKPQLGTTVTFDDAGLVTQRGSKVSKKITRRVAFAKIRSVQRAPGSLVIMGRHTPIVFIPERALPGGGEQIMSFFEDRLIAKGSLYRATSGRMTIVNTTSP